MNFKTSMWKFDEEQIIGIVSKFSLQNTDYRNSNTVEKPGRHHFFFEWLQLTLVLEQFEIV